jgi:predicted ATPase/class 3 adenylate cyclase
MLMVNPPSGTVTFLFTDIEGSTKLAQAYPEQWESLRARHHAILHTAIEAQSGYIFQEAGDSFCAAFHTAPEAIKAALAAQLELQRESWEPAPIKVRMGIHTGAAQLNRDLQSGYMGYTTLALTNRIMSAGHGGQILLSGATRELTRDALPESTELLDLGEKRLKDLLRPEHLSQLTSPGLQAAFPPLKTLEAFPNNLPMQLTTFIGREKEIGKVKAELESHRLVTLTGSGGTGKTRLSLQVAADLLDQFEQGVWFVELAPLADPELIPQAVLSTIGISEQAGKPAMEILKEYLHEKQVLIVLDNCEHLIEASTRVTNGLLNFAPGLKILASSREALGVQGEVSYPVPSLSLPDPKHMPAIEQLSQFEAVRLFIDRALLVAAQFTVDKNNAPYIAQICYRLDGIPLAIELAAARIKVMSVGQISARLDDRFRLLTGGARTALPRQQTLRALIDWSYDILTENERLLLRRLSVFVGGWTLEAAEEVCSGEGIEPYEILDLLSQLVNKSLVSVIECSSCNVMRYRMLETIRQYAREKLLETGGSEGLHQRHLAYFRKLAEQAGPELFHSHQAEWLDRLENELDNLRLALEWALDGDVPAGLKLMENSFPFWEARGYLRESSDWLRNLLERYHQEDSLRARLLALFAWWVGFMMDFNQALKNADQSLQLSRAISDRQAEASSLLALGVATAVRGDMETGIQIVEQSRAIYQELGDLMGQASANLWLSLDHNDLERSKALVSESLRLFRELGHISGIANSLGELAMRTIWAGDFSTPVAWLEEAHSLYRQLGDQSGESKILYLYGILKYWQGDYLNACTYSEEAIAISEKYGNSIYTFWARATRMYSMMQQGDLPKAKELFASSVQECQKANDEIGLLFTLEGLSSLQFKLEHFQTAARLFGWTDARRVEIGNQRPPVEQASIEKEQELLCSKLGDEAFKALYKEGTALTLDQAIALTQEA